MPFFATPSEAPAAPPPFSGAVNLIVSIHLTAGSDALAQALAGEASRISAGLPVTQWVDADRKVFRCQFALRPDVVREPLGSVLGGFARAAGPALGQIIVVTSTRPEPARLPAQTLVLEPVKVAAAVGSETERLPPVHVEAPAPAPRAALTEREVPRLAPTPLSTPRRRSSDPSPAPGVDFAVAACALEGLRGVVVATGESVTVQTPEPWDVVEGELLTFRPTRHWRFARSSLSTGEFVATRVDAALLPGTPLELIEGANGFALEMPILEGDPEDPTDDPILDAYEALGQGRVGDARQLARGAIEENVRSLAAHDVLARAALASGDSERARRHDAVLLAIAEEALAARPTAVLDPSLASNAPLVAAIARADEDVRGRWARVFGA